jgi:hypothetical protein
MTRSEPHFGKPLQSVFQPVESNGVTVMKAKASAQNLPQRLRAHGQRQVRNCLSSVLRSLYSYESTAV